MKNLFMAIVLLTGISTFAQQEKSNEQADKIERFTPEQRRELKLKEITLKLDLSASQQKEMAKIIAEQDAKREAAKAERKTAKEKGTKPTAEQRFTNKSKRLDNQIAMNQRMKSFLTPEQMQKWDELKSEKKERMRQTAKRGQKKTPGRKVDKN